MSIKHNIPGRDGVYFITFTCCRWLHLFRMTDSYGIVYNWFDILKQNGHLIIGYVIMPNHVHVIIAFKNALQSINTIISNGKRFMAYEIVSRLSKEGKENILQILKTSVSRSDRRNGKLHQVFEPSFDCKECITDKFIEQKLSYIHMNPCVGIWQLANEPCRYKHSSALYYYTGNQGVYEVTNYALLHDIDLTR